MKYLKYFEGYIFEDDTWFDDWESLPEWEFLSLMGFTNVTTPGDKRKIQIRNKELASGVLNLTKGGYVRRPGGTSPLFSFGGGVSLKRMLGHIAKRYIKKGISKINSEDLDRIILRNPGMIEILDEIPKVQDVISSRTGVGNPKGDYYKRNNITPAIAKWLDASCQKWSINEETGLIDALMFKPKSKGTSGFRGVKFGEIKISFDCSEMNLSSLDGAPHTVGGDFNCSSNHQLIDLKGAPSRVGSSFSVVYCNNLKSLEGCPEIINGNFHCKNNPNLETLIGGPLRVEGRYDINTQSWNGNEKYKIRSLEGIANYIGGGLYINQHRIDSINNPAGLVKDFNEYKDQPEVRDLLIPFISEDKLDAHIKKNPLDIDLLEELPEIKAGVLKRTGIKDMTTLAKNIRLGFI